MPGDAHGLRYSPRRMGTPQITSPAHITTMKQMLPKRRNPSKNVDHRALDLTPPDGTPLHSGWRGDYDAPSYRSTERAHAGPGLPCVSSRHCWQRLVTG